jgi:formate dehydrogenase major subunit
LEFVIVEDLFLTETARTFATVFLPACSSFEKDGTFMNAERRIQRVRAALPPIGGSRPDWQIVCDVARALDGHGFDFQDPREIWDEVRRCCTDGAGLTYARLEAEGLQWPCPSDDHPGTRILHTIADHPLALRAIDFHPTPERVTRRYPFLLITGRSLYQFNAGTMTGRTRNSDLRPSDLLEISPADAVAAGLRDGRSVRLISRYGEAVLPVAITSRQQPGQLFATFQSSGILLNRVTGRHRDTTTGTPNYKVTAVRIEQLPVSEVVDGSSP